MSILAVVIPAFKSEFLEKTLQSLADQSVKNFNVYIGDDNSPEDLEHIVKQFIGKLDLRYTKFESNLGSVSIVKQWDRCINLSIDEPWIWLMGDDDLADSECIKYFYKELDKQDDFDLYRFNMKVIDPFGNKLYDAPRFPEVESGWDFISARLAWKRASALCPYIFSRAVYLEKNGFTEFELGWCSDDATWLKFSGVRGIKTISGPEVSWRFGANISADSSLIERKINAWISYSDWLINYSMSTNLNRKSLIRKIKRWLIKNIRTSGDKSSLLILKKNLDKSDSLIHINWLDLISFEKLQ